MNALNAYNRLNVNVSGMKKASEKLSSGYRINRAGDDAAGLAISEKMRSQIRGLGQAKRNAQDGISMIQTFEGAAQETHSILQRMKELATESANGTYDNRTDRAAIQLEFDQLNDELNQIADTDYNGTIVLNGGVMSDGLEVGTKVDGLGEFNYKDKQTQLTNKINDLTAEIDTLKKGAPLDIFKPDNGIFNTVDENAYDLDAAEDLWGDDFLKLNADTDQSVDITYTATVTDGVVSYKATSATAYKADGSISKQLGEDDLTALNDKVVAVNETGNAKGPGGFKVGTDTDDDIFGRVIFDASDIKTGDVITLHYDGPGVSPKAPANAGIVDDTYTNGLKATKLTKGDAPSVTVKVEDSQMTDDIRKILDILNGKYVEFKVADGAATTDKVECAANNDIKIGGASSDGGTTITGGQGFTKGDDGSLVTFNTGTANEVKMWVKHSDDDGKLTISALDDTGAAEGQAILEIDLGTYANDTGADVTNMNFAIAYDSYTARGGADIDIEAKLTSSTVNPKQAEIDKKTAELEKLQKELGVSKSDAFGQSKAIMNYAENITLQTGARTKDAVKFTFNYNMDKTADMGELKANLDLSSRSNGLATADLSLATAESANHAIDQIDKAINKTSMVRASFGAIQNRLEHKIDNLTTTNENLTEAESNIRDTDMAQTMMDYTKFNILQQAAQSMLAQANQQPQSILQLLG